MRCTLSLLSSPTCASLGSNVKQRRVNASGNALRQFHPRQKSKPQIIKPPSLTLSHPTGPSQHTEPSYQFQREAG